MKGERIAYPYLISPSINRAGGINLALDLEGLLARLIDDDIREFEDSEKTKLSYHCNLWKLQS